MEKIKFENKKNAIDKLVNTRTKQMEIEADKKKKDEEKIELMTQFMLDPTSSATKLLEKRREMYELQEALQRDKDKFIEKEEQFKKTEEELRNRDEEFHRKIVEYYKTTFEKKQTENYNYIQKLDDETKLQSSLDNSIKHLETKNDKLKGDQEKLKKIHDSLKKYEEFLKSVKEKHPDNFNDINDIISKFKTLKETHENIKEEEERARRRKEEERYNFKKTKSEYEARINNVITGIQTIQTDLKVLLFILIY